MSEPQWGATGKQVYERTYSRKLPNGEPEVWRETVERVVSGNLGLVDERYHEPHERAKLIDLIFNFKAVPAGRHLWMSGVPGRQFLFNCHHAGWNGDITEHFTFTFDQLMQGGGVGANYSSYNLDQYAPVDTAVNLHIVCDPDHADWQELFEENLLSTEYSSDWTGAIRVEDSREGWADALAELIREAYSGKSDSTLVFDLTLLRHRGAKIRTFGGTAAGPAPLAKMLTHVSGLLNARVGDKLRSLDAMSIDHEIANCVVSGNVRRSARMAIKNWAEPDIFDFITCKRDKNHHWSTNISVEIDKAFFQALARKDPHAVAVFRGTVTAMLQDGEPGFYNRSLAQQGEVGNVESTNPCGEIALEQWENCFAGDERLLTKEYGSVSLADVVGETVTVMSAAGWTKAEINYFGEQGVQLVRLVPVRKQGDGWQRTRSNYSVDITVTPDHRWKLVDGTVTTALAIGDTVPAGAAQVNEGSQEFQDGVRHGIVFGDGSQDRTYINGDYRSRVRFYGVNADEMQSYFEHVTHPDRAGVAEGWLRTSVNMKEFPTESNPDYLGGFMRGWMLADGNRRPGGSVHLGSTHPDADAWLRRNAAQAGWVLRASRDSGVQETNLGVRKNPLRFFTLVQPGEDIAWRVEIIEVQPEVIPVYCATVPGEENFTLAAGVATMNCNLGHVNLDSFVGDDDGAREAHRLMTRYLIRATFGDVPNPKQAAVLARNRRIGVGHFGFQGWATKQGVRYSDTYRNSEIRAKLRSFYDAVREEARSYSFQLRIPEPIKVTTVAPTGTIAKLPGKSEGIHPIYAKYFVRRVRYSTVDPDQIAAVARLVEEGHHTEPDQYSTNTVVVEFLTKDSLMQEVEDLGLDADFLVESADEISLNDMLGVQAMYQAEYADNAVSFTVNVKPDSLQEAGWKQQLADGVATWDLKMPKPSPQTVDNGVDILYRWLPYLKGTTIMVDGSRPQSPYERMTRAEFELAEYAKSVDDSFDEACASGACPVK